METKALFGMLSSLFVLIGGIPYIVGIHHEKIRPHVLSWLGWAFITLLGGSAMLAEGSQWIVAIIFANTLSCLIVVFFSVYKRVGVWSTTKWDYVFFGLGILGLILWQSFDMPILAIICAILADLSFGLPTIIKTWKDTTSETRFPWLMCSLSGLLSLFALKNFSFAELAYPLYLFIYDTVQLFLVSKIIYRKI